MRPILAFTMSALASAAAVALVQACAPARVPEVPSAPPSASASAPAETAAPIASASMSAAPASPPTVEAIVEKVNARYAHKTSYQDQATVRVTYFDADDDAMLERQYQVVIDWATEDKLFFEMREASWQVRLAIWSRNGETHASSRGEVRSTPRMEVELAEGSGVSHDITLFVLHWIVLGQPRLGNYVELRGTKPCGGFQCFELVGKIGQDTRATYVDVESGVVRRVVMQRRRARTPDPKASPAGKKRARAAVTPSLGDAVETTYELHPVFDEPIDDHVFEVATPKRRHFQLF